MINTLYRYTEDSGSGNKRMHRHIESDDVIEYSSEARKKSVNLLKDEDIEYRNGVLHHSSGSTLVKLKGVQSQGEQERSISEAFSAQGSYSLDLQQCYIPDKHMQSRQRRSLSSKMNGDLKEEDLKAHFDTCNSSCSYA